jgi:hypothetical protein
MEIEFTNGTDFRDNKRENIITTPETKISFKYEFDPIDGIFPNKYQEMFRVKSIVLTPKN